MSSTILFLAKAKATKSLDTFLMESLVSSSLIHSRVFLEDKALSTVEYALLGKMISLLNHANLELELSADKAYRVVRTHHRETPLNEVPTPDVHQGYGDRAY